MGVLYGMKPATGELTGDLLDSSQYFRGVVVFIGD